MATSLANSPLRSRYIRQSSHMSKLEAKLKMRQIKKLKVTMPEHLKKAKGTSSIPSLQLYLTERKILPISEG